MILASKAVQSETQRSKLERKERVILEAARAIFVDHGFDGARVQEIARRAGIGEGTIYSYYESKAELMLAVLQQFWDGLTLEMTMEADRSTRDQQPVVDDMVALFRAHYGADAERGGAGGATLVDLSRQIEQLAEKVETLSGRLS